MLPVNRQGARYIWIQSPLPSYADSGATSENWRFELAYPGDQERDANRGVNKTGEISRSRSYLAVREVCERLAAMHV